MRGPEPKAGSRFKGAPSASGSGRAEDAAEWLPRDASSTLGVTPAAAPLSSHPPHGPPPARHSQWCAAQRPARPPRAPAPANLRPPGDARRAIGCHARPSAPRPAHLPRSVPLHPASLPVTAGSATTRPRRLRPLPRLPSPSRWERSLHSEPGRRQRALTCLRLSSTRLRRRHPTPGHQTLGPAPACGVSTQPRPGGGSRRVGGAVTSQNRAAPARARGLLPRGRPWRRAACWVRRGGLRGACGASCRWLSGGPRGSAGRKAASASGARPGRRRRGRQSGTRGAPARPGVRGAVAAPGVPARQRHRCGTPRPAAGVSRRFTRCARHSL